MSENAEGKWDGLPGAELIEQGIRDLQEQKLTEHALLVLVGEPRLRSLHIQFPPFRPPIAGPVEHALYDLLELSHGEEAFNRYNTLLRRMTSFAHALERENATIPPSQR